MAFDAFLKIDGLDVQSEIEVLSFSWGATQTGNRGGGGGGGAGKVQVHDISITKFTDNATAPLFQALVKGVIFPKVELTVRRMNSDGKPFIPYKLNLTKVMISSMQAQGASGGDPLPTEQVSMNYSKIEVFSLKGDFDREF